MLFALGAFSRQGFEFSRKGLKADLRVAISLRFDKNVPPFTVGITGFHRSLCGSGLGILRYVFFAVDQCHGKRFTMVIKV